MQKGERGNGMKIEEEQRKRIKLGDKLDYWPKQRIHADYNKKHNSGKRKVDKDIILSEEIKVSYQGVI